MDGYDLDDTLSDVDYDQADTRGLATVFRQAGIIYTPSSEFVVITARTQTADAKRATEDWLTSNFELYRGTYYVSGSEQEIIQGKADFIRELGLASFTDNNLAILDALADLVPATVQLYYMDDGSRVKR